MKLLRDGQKELGNKWAEIAKRIPGRNESSVKNRWYNVKTSEKKVSLFVFIHDLLFISILASNLFIILLTRPRRRPSRH